MEAEQNLYFHTPVGIVLILFVVTYRRPTMRSRDGTGASANFWELKHSSIWKFISALKKEQSMNEMAIE
jgi:hypothetical protein